MNTKLSILFYIKRAKSNSNGLSAIYLRVTIEDVLKMLGHKNLKTTQHYAKILNLKVSNDMKILKEKFTTGNRQNMKNAN